MITKLTQCSVCESKYSLLYRHDQNGWFSVCPKCGSYHHLDIPDLEDGRVTMIFVFQDPADPYKNFVDYLPYDDIDTLQFCYVKSFEDPKKFMTEWYKIINDYPGYNIPSMWYFVFDGKTNILTGAMDPYDDEPLAEHFGERLRGWRRPKAFDLREDCIKLLQKRKRFPEEKLRMIYDILNPTVIHGEDGVCPVCGAEVEFNGDQEIVDTVTKVTYHCPNCGCDGEQWAEIQFDGHSNVYCEESQSYVIY